MPANHTEMQRGQTLIILPLRCIDTMLDIELVPVLHMLHHQFANNDEAKLSCIMQRKSSIVVFSLQCDSLARFKFVKNIRQKLDRLVVHTQQTGLLQLARGWAKWRRCRRCEKF